MAPQHESLPLIGKYASGRLKASRPGQNKIRRISSIQKELGPEAQKGTASLFDVGINLAKTAGKNIDRCAFQFALKGIKTKLVFCVLPYLKTLDQVSPHLSCQYIIVCQNANKTEINQPIDQRPR